MNIVKSDLRYLPTLKPAFVDEPFETLAIFLNFLNEIVYETVMIVRAIETRTEVIFMHDLVSRNSKDVVTIKATKIHEKNISFATRTFVTIVL